MTTATIETDPPNPLHTLSDEQAEAMRRQVLGVPGEPPK